MIIEAVWLALRWFQVGTLLAATVGVLILAGPIPACLGCH